ncbi:MAG: T9SS type A sorting domain-containing protein [Bacteroidota bacterium]
MLRYYFSFLCLIWSFVLGIGQDDITYTRDIAPIIYANCAECHRTGEIGPMPLTQYEEVKNWAEMIEYVTSIRYMPPWKADRAYSRFLGERFLTDSEIDKISKWVTQGMPQGNAQDETPFPDFPKGSQIGEPDLVLSFSEAFLHKGNNSDQYQVFVLPTGLKEDKILKAIELRPGNRSIVHHALFGLDTSGEARELDAETPEYGFEDFGGFGVEPLRQYPAYAPGSRPKIYPLGAGQKIEANADLLVQMHYAPVPTDEWDSSSVNLFFADATETIDREVETHLMLPFQNVLVNGPFLIPPGRETTFHGIWTLEEKISMLGIAPHMHLLGKDWTVYAISPEGDTTNLILIEDWDFNWQTYYFFQEYKVLEKGSQIHAFATYDNTEANPLNPNSPPQWMSWGEKTTEEMYYLALMYAPYKAGDEDVVFDDNIATSLEDPRLDVPENKFYPIFPNPTGSSLTIGFSFGGNYYASLQILDVNGRTVDQPFRNEYFPPGRHRKELSVEKLSSGIYFAQLSGPGFQLSQRFLIQ